ncbi:MAG: hypothetical protein MJY96_10580, partial [Bacteroidaceae bacterium]|nr:hypothetical protein [Bacteroidaceae bacterium]
CRGHNAPRGNKRNATQGRVPVPYGLLCQIALNNEEPPYAERHVRWCERSENEVGRKLLLFSSYSIFGSVAKVWGLAFCQTCSQKAPKADSLQVWHQYSHKSRFSLPDLHEKRTTSFPAAGLANVWWAQKSGIGIRSLALPSSRLQCVFPPFLGTTNPCCSAYGGTNPVIFAWLVPPQAVQRQFPVPGNGKRHKSVIFSLTHTAQRIESENGINVFPCKFPLIRDYALLHCFRLSRFYSPIRLKT